MENDQQMRPKRIANKCALILRYKPDTDVLETVECDDFPAYRWALKEQKFYSYDFMRDYQSSCKYKIPSSTLDKITKDVEGKLREENIEYKLERFENRNVFSTEAYLYGKDDPYCNLMCFSIYNISLDEKSSNNLDRFNKFIEQIHLLMKNHGKPFGCDVSNWTGGRGFI